MKVAGYRFRPFHILLLAAPASWILEAVHAPAPWIFAAAAVAIIPLAGILGEATEQLAARLGAGLGGFLNATFGNAAELIIALFALGRGLTEIVKASITGSIIGNGLLVLGASLVAGGLRYPRLAFNSTAAGLGGTLLVLSITGLLVPALYEGVTRNAGTLLHPRELSLFIAVILFVTYGLSLVFSLKTHQHLFAGHESGAHAPEALESAWSRRRSLGLLLVATALIALESEILVGAVEATAAQFGFTEVFVGVIIVAVIGNAAEHSTAILVALKNKMDLSLNIAIGSSIQVALFIAPLLVFTSYAMGRPMDLVFTPFEVLAVGMSTLILNLVALDGESHWMEGVLLLAVYAIFAVAFYYLPP